jgi:hypothetical protein
VPRTERERPDEYLSQNPNLGRRSGFPGKNAYVIWERGRESRLSRHLRRVARERAIKHHRDWVRFRTSVSRRLLRKGDV